MKRKQCLGAGLALAATLSLGAVALPAAAAVTVNFVQPDNFRDLPFSPTDRAQVLKELGDHFAAFEKSLPPGQDLKIEVLDLDLAGRMVPNYRSGQEIRVLRGGADWPHMTLRYTLTANGQVVSSGEEQLSDMAYLDRINNYAEGEPLRYEKRMIDDWFKKKFGAAPRG